MTVPAYVDTPRLCQELSICERTVDAWVRQGLLPAPRQRGGKRLWKWIEVEQYLDNGAPGMAASADSEAERIRDATRQLAAKKKDH
jgi:predicted site-specific integrase-resolvase